MNAPRKKPQKNLEDIIYNGKLPPQAIDLEEAVLGAMMLEKNAPAKVANILYADAFYNDSNKMIYAAIIGLYNEKKEIDMLTVTERLRKDGNLMLVGGPFHVTNLTSRVASAAHIEYHAHLIIEKKILRDLIHLAGDIGKKAFDETTDPFALKDEMEQSLLKLNNSISTSREKDWSKSIEDTLTQIRLAMEDPENISGIPTGHIILDALTGGWQNTDFIVLAGRPGMGKTARGLGFLKAAVKDGKKCKFYSFEMSIVQLIKRMLAEESGLDLQDINRGRLSDYSYGEIARIAEEMKSLPIKVNDDGRMNILELASECRMLANNKQLDFVIIDYLQIVKGPRNHNMNRNDLIGFITGECKNIAKECNIPLMALAQVGRTGQERPDLENLRESGNIEQDADVVIFYHRPSYHTKGDKSKEKEDFLKEMDEKQYLQYGEMIIAKHRNGKTKIVKEYFDGSTQKFKAFFSKEEEEKEIGVTEQKDDNKLPF